MKTLHLLIIIVASGIMITTVVVLQTPHIQIRIDGLNDTYSVGTPIDFFVTAESYGKFCAGPEVSILDATNQSNEVWWGASPAYTGMYCDLHQEEFTFHAGAHSEFASHTNLPIILNKTGQYIVRAKLGNTFSEKEFSIIPIESNQIDNASSNISTIVIPKDSDDPTAGKTFEPQYLTVILGVNNTVSWINKSDAGDEIDTTTYNQPDPMFEKGPYSHGTILPGKSFNFTFTKPGEFEYHTQPHPWLQGSIVVLPQSPENATQTVVLSNTTIPGPCEMFGLPCPLNADHTFTAQKFGSDVYIEKIIGNGIDHYAVIHPSRSCVYPPGYNVGCTNPDDLAILKLIGVHISTVS